MHKSTAGNRMLGRDMAIQQYAVHIRFGKFLAFGTGRKLARGCLVDGRSISVVEPLFRLT
jgi:hypothetical protein